MRDILPANQGPKAVLTEFYLLARRRLQNICSGELIRKEISDAFRSQDLRIQGIGNPVYAGLDSVYNIVGAERVSLKDFQVPSLPNEIDRGPKGDPPALAKVCWTSIRRAQV